jgi:hypothetical protein
VAKEGLQKIFQELTKEKFPILLYYDNNEVHQADTNIEVSCPAVLDGEKFHNGIGFLIKNDAGETYFLVITKKDGNIREILSPYQKKENVNY